MIIQLTAFDLSLAALLVVALAVVCRRLRLGIGGRLIWSAVRTVLQLSLIGFVLKALFAGTAPGWVLLMSLVMLFAAGREVLARQKHPLRGGWGFGAGLTAMFISSFAVTVLALAVIVGPEPWYAPRYAIPLLGMMLGNTMNGLSLSLNHLTQNIRRNRAVIETRLALGQTKSEAVSDIRHDSVRTGLIPIINAMAAAGIVSLPGMMTGQILAGNPPVDSVKYQILIMFLIAGGTGFGTLVAVWLTSHRLFDHRHRLRLDRLSN
ncbi:ABC transporter permease [Tichowtungia aerotolerans]|uniref:Iron export ABC transporter permease subunit FetB n=1 Tax=Tichowtungia aerotolerans TaxID=2697043 RepID=A0A6P1M595_9BACT|nr:iron export ABC transporter permease subunit FetB [Tichowtungia aerotolerans]QHI68163.1 iron export ABC transporter permease subunit FetB [Tichowtungia aerotolerans]